MLPGFSWATSIFGFRKDQGHNETFYTNYSKGITGSTITVEKALEHSTVFGCLDRIANTIAQMEWCLEEYKGGKWVKLTKPPRDIPENRMIRDVYRRLYWPNELQTPREFKYQLAFNIPAYGNAFIYKEISDNGRMTEWLALNPQYVDGVKETSTY